MSKWIFVITANYQEFERRVREGKWPMFKNTAHKFHLRPGDDVLFYKGGKDGQKFLGRGKISSKLKSDGTSNSHVTISDVDIWQKPVPIRPLIPDLTFVFHKVRWGLHFQGGVVTLYEKDFDYIVSKSN